MNHNLGSEKRDFLTAIKEDYEKHDSEIEFIKNNPKEYSDYF